MHDLTAEERIVLERVGAAIQLRRKLEKLRPMDIAGRTGLSGTALIRLERGFQSTRLISLVRAFSGLGITSGRFATIIEKIVTTGFSQEQIDAARRQPIKRGRPTGRRDAKVHQPPQGGARVSPVPGDNPLALQAGMPDTGDNEEGRST